MPASSSASSSSWPAGPTNGRPARSSRSPGCSPTNISSAERPPSPNTVCVPFFHRSHARQPAAAPRRAVNDLRPLASSAAESSSVIPRRYLGRGDPKPGRLTGGRGGETCAMTKLGSWARKRGARAARQRGDVHALDVEGGPRGGVQSDEYRHADPRDIVQDGDVVMSGPGGTPQEGVEVEERRLLSGLWRRRRGRTGAVR